MLCYRGGALCEMVLAMIIAARLIVKQCAVECGDKGDWKLRRTLVL